MLSKKILIVSGEPSGDLHASNLVRDLRSLNPSLSFFGMGGDLCRGSGVDIVFDISDLALVGVVEVLRHLTTVKKAHDAVMDRVKKERPDLAILVDYPGFNLKLAIDLAKMSVPIVYYISPQLWAWGKQRIHIIKRCVRKMIVFFKFEESLYRSWGIDTECVGHPLLDIVKVTSPQKDVFEKYNLADGKFTIALLPGSRISEIRNFMPVLGQASELIEKRLGNTQFIISKRPERPMELYEEAITGFKFDIRFAEEDLHNIVAASDLAIVASGTATLETAILGTPLIVIYRANFLTFLLYKMVSTTRYLGIVNIVAGKEIAPELLQFNMTPEKIASKAIEMLSSPELIASIRRELAAVKASLGSPGASLRAAQAIIALLR
ncbi:MAG: lipid-A-disaccharide synthase [Candidatus Omnitrophica bacterium]|nr:lipid-A-disaccharide synthase [Candidatus Omnitrophota bacterium]